MGNMTSVKALRVCLENWSCMIVVILFGLVTFFEIGRLWKTRHEFGLDGLFVFYFGSFREITPQIYDFFFLTNPQIYDLPMMKLTCVRITCFINSSKSMKSNNPLTSETTPG